MQHGFSCREDEEERYTFSSRLVDQTTPKRTTSLDSPGKGSAREWDDKGPRSGGERRVPIMALRAARLDVNRPGASQGKHAVPLRWHLLSNGLMPSICTMTCHCHAMPCYARALLDHALSSPDAICAEIH